MLAAALGAAAVFSVTPAAWATTYTSGTQTLSGSYSDTVINTGADLVVSSPITITGDYNQSSGTLKVESSGELVVSGNATITGGTVLASFSSNRNYLVGDTRTLVNAGSLSSSGIPVTSSIPAISMTNTVTGTKLNVICENDYVGTDLSSLTNTGSITGHDYAVYIASTGNLGTLTNTGTLSGTSVAIHNAGSIGQISNSGTITGTGYGIYNSGTLTLINTGNINSDGYWIYVDGGSAIVNSNNGGTLYGAAYVSNGTLNLTMNNSTWTITGSASGSYRLIINDQGGNVSSATAVKIVDIASGATSTATFTGGYDSGAYCYGVAQGSALSTYFSGLDSNDYYYYNTSVPSNTSKAAMAENAGTVVAWYGELNEIKKRLGDLRIVTQSSGDLWARTYADKYSVRPGGGYAFSQIMRGVELGKDNSQEYQGSKKYTGFLLGFGQANNTYSAGGSGTTDSNYVGAYASWLKDDGTYIDLIGKYNWLRHDFTTPVLSGTNDSGLYRNQALGLSMEIGKHINRANGVFIEPQLELASLWSNQASYTTTRGLAVDVPSVRSLQLRLGCTVGQNWTDRNGANRQFYGKVSWVNEHAGDSKTIVDSAAFDSSLKGHQWVTGLGFIEDTKRYQLYTDVEKSWGNTTSKAWGINAGYRWKM